jgi:hypothetical protein
MEAVAESKAKTHNKTSQSGLARRCFSWLVFAALGVITSFFAYEYLLNHVDREIRQHVLRRFQADFPNCRVAVGRAHLDPGRGIVIEDVSLSLPTESGSQQAIFIRRLKGVGTIDIPDLFSPKIPIQRWEVLGLDLSLWKVNGRWAIQNFLPEHKSAFSPCDISIREGTIRFKENATDDEEMLFHDLSAQLSPLPSSKVSVSLQTGATQAAAFPSSPDAAPIYQIQGGKISSSYFRTLTFAGMINAGTGEWECRGKVGELLFGPVFRDRLPEDAAQYLLRLAGLECVVDAEFKIGQKDKASVPQFEIGGMVNNGRLKDASIPYLLEDLRGRFFVDNRMINLREIRASSGQSTIELEANLLGFKTNSPLHFHVLARNLELDRRLYQALPVSLQRQWDRFMLEGKVDADLEMTFDGHEWSPIAVVDCRGVSLRYAQFPYPITHLNGRIDYRNHRLKSLTPITARASGQTIGGEFHLEVDSSTWQGWIDMASDALIPIDDLLIDSLTPRGAATSSVHTFVRSLNPSGNLQINKVRIEKPSFDSQTLNRDIRLAFQKGSIKFKDFPYPIHDISGTLSAQNDHWSISNFIGLNDSSRIACDGSWHSSATSIEDLRLQFLASNISLDEQLRQSLPQSVGNLWHQLQPKGRVEKVDIVYSKKSSNDIADLTVNLSQPPSIPGVYESSLSIQPLPLPYLLQQVACELQYQQGVVHLRSFSADHGLTHLQTEGSVQQTPGGWVAVLKWLPTTRVSVDSSFVAALPRRMRETLRQMDFKGPVGILGWSQVGPITDSNVSEDVLASWDLELDLEDAKLKDGSWVQGIRGTIRTAGYSTPNGPIADGFMLIDSMALRGVPLANIQGPFALRENKIYYGQKVADVKSLSSSASVAPNPIQADLFSGKAVASGTGDFDPFRFSMETHLYGGQLQDILMETGQASAEASGICDAKITLQGSPLNPQTFSGTGEVAIREASLFQLPGMMKLLRVLSVKPPNDAAFEKADVSFRIDGDRLPIDHLSIDGDVLSLAGSGWANLRREMHLDLYAYVGNRNQLAKLIGPLLSETRYAPLMQVEINGTVETPEMTRKPLPVIEDALKTYFPERYANENKGVLKF